MKITRIGGFYLLSWFYYGKKLMSGANQGVGEIRYSVIPRTLIFIMRDDSVLLIKGSPTKRLWPGMYNGVGGHIEKGEDVFSAACREVKEETGLTIRQLWLCGTVSVDLEGNIGILFFVFRGIYEKGELMASQEGSLEWIPIDNISHFHLVEDVPFLLDKVFSMGQGSFPFSARYYYGEKGELHIDCNL